MTEIVASGRAGPRHFDVVCRANLQCGFGGAVVLLEALLGNPIECQCGDRAINTRHGHAPFTYGTAPTGSVVAINPDHPFHFGPFVFRIGTSVGRGKGSVKE